MIDRRTFLSGAAVAASTVPVRAATRQVDTTVGQGGDFPTLAEALAVAASANRLRFRILLRNGVHDEKLTMTTPGVEIIGESRAAILTHADASGTPKPGGGSWGTSGSATLTIAAPDVTLRGLTIANGFDFIGAHSGNDAVKNGFQAVALLIDRSADRTRVIDCAIEGYQDTLYVNARAWFSRCCIAGGVDFIFGGGAALFDACEIVTRFVPDAPGQGYVAAPSTPAAQRFGLVFDRCRLTREPGVPDQSAFLGRPWRAGGNMALTGSATFLRCWMGAHIRREGWTAMGYRDQAGTQHLLTPQEARLAEFASIGPGAAPASPSRRQLTRAEAAEFTPAAILDGWSASHR
ncbi:MULTISPECIES: pectinesterase family protein [Sphingomonas]|uniref:pectinesterase family protein n=1 Tax=Sphingomonas TaxID=13687 RepID=UPI000A424B84|nr:pectinesterase family protein [Sphingomonas sp. CCH10-B3]